MNLSDFLLPVGSVVVGIISWLLKALWADHKEVKQHAEKVASDLHEFKLYVSREHATKANLAAVVEECTRSYEAVFRILDDMRKTQPEQFDKLRDHIDTMGKEFRDRLDKKVDKP